MSGESTRSGLASRDPRHPDFTAISWVVLQEVKSDLDAALLRLELMRREQGEPSIARAADLVRAAVAELDSLGGSDRVVAADAPSG